MASREDEFETFKTEIDLRQYASSQGYEIRAKKSYGSSTVMERAGDIVVIGQSASNGHWIYWQVHAAEKRVGEDCGSIIDFVKHRLFSNYGKIRQELRPWVSGSQAYHAPTFAKPKPVTKDAMKVKAEYEITKPVSSHPYLEQERYIPADVLTDSRFAGRIRIDERGNAIFPHIDTEGVSGFEKKNDGFTGFASGGTKGLWASRTREGDTTLVIAETAIDALSQFALKKPGNARYVSTGGAFSPTQHDLLKRAIEKMPEGSQIILALDHDEGGDKLASRIEAIFDEIEGAGRVLVNDRPPIKGQDWNNALRASVANSGPVAEPVPEP